MTKTEKAKPGRRLAGLMWTSLAACLLLSTGLLRAQVPAAEREALIRIYNENGGSQWREQSGWLGPEGTECSWSGVECEDDHVASFGVPDLTGVLSPAIGDLSRLKRFNVGLCPNLTGLPAEIGQLTDLDFLQIAGCGLTGLPPEIGNLSNLQTLGLDGNNMTGPIPEVLGNLTNLRRLTINGRISLIPSEHENALSGPIPAALGNLVNLEHLAFSHNRLTSIPCELANLTNLKFLLLDSNSLTGQIPECLADLPSLIVLSLDFNQFSGPLPEFLASMPSLRGIGLRANQFSGPIPEAWMNNPNLTGLVLSENDLTGIIPPSIGNLHDLDTLWLRGNRLVGPIPPELGQTSLTWLDLADNQLTGTIPVELANLTELRHLYLQNNQLTGSIPEELLALENLIDADFSGNMLDGQGPDLVDPPDTVQYLTQVVAGKNESVQFSSRIFLTNRGANTQAWFHFFDDQGEPSDIGFRWVEGSDQLGNALEGEYPCCFVNGRQFLLQRGESMSLELVADQPFQSGYIRLEAGKGVSAMLVIKQTDPSSGIDFLETSIPSSVELVSSFSIFVDTLGENDTGLALLLPAQEGDDNSEPARARLSLYDLASNKIASQEIDLVPGQKLARFVSEFFDDPEIKQKASEMEGVLAVEALTNHGFAVIALRQKRTVGQFPAAIPFLTAFPVMEGRPDL